MREPCTGVAGAADLFLWSFGADPPVPPIPCGAEAAHHAGGGRAVANAPEIVRQLTRQYPPLLRDANMGGLVVLALRVGPDGRVASRVAIADPRPELGASALRVVERLRFDPAPPGAAADAEVLLPIRWAIAPLYPRASTAGRRKLWELRR